MSDPFLLYLERPTRQRYTQLVLEYAGPVGRLVRRLVPSAAADDIIQETFLALAATRKKREEIRNPRSFVLQTAVQLARNQKRASATRARHEETASRSRPRSYPSASDEAAGREAVHRLHEAIGSLPPQLR